MRFLAHAMPGLGPLLRDELGGTLESDGRSDVVVFDGAPIIPRTAEDVFVQIAESRTTRGLVTKAGLEHALSVFANVVRPLRRNEGFRVVARVKNETVKRTAFRDALISEVQHARPRWHPADPADIEIWVAQTGRNTWRSAIRLTRRAHRTVEREGALRPSVAATMVRLAGDGGTLLDPCCGSGTILIEARAAGWRAYGSDLDPDTAKRNGQAVVTADARRLPFPDDSFDAVVSNLPFGAKFERVEGITDDLLRVAPKAVVLTPDGAQGIDIVLLGRRVKLAVLTR
jgi:23S rRNA G2445 N2-methylase RlmL